MTEREQKIRELIARLLARPGISREYTILNVSDAEFLLAELARERQISAVLRTQVPTTALPLWFRVWEWCWKFLKGTTA